MGARKRVLTEADRRAAQRVRELWNDYRQRNPGITQEKAAELAGFSQSAMSQFLLGTVPMRLTPVLKFAKLFGIEPREIRNDLSEVRYSMPPPAEPLRTTEPSSPAISPQAIEIARAYMQLQPQSQELFRRLLFAHTLIDRHYPWLRAGRPVSDNYAAFERWHEENIRRNQAGQPPTRRTRALKQK